MPAEDVMGKWASGKLHSGSKTGPVVKNRKQAIAIKMSEQKAEDAGKKEYQPGYGLTRGARFPKHGK